MKEGIEVGSEIMVHWEFHLQDGRIGHHTKHRAFDPERIVEATSVSDQWDVYFSTAIHEGVGGCVLQG